LIGIILANFSQHTDVEPAVLSLGKS